MAFSIKNVALYLSLGLLLVCGLSIAYLFDVIESQAIHNGKLETKLLDTATKNLSLALTISNLNQEIKQAQMAADALALEHSKQKQQTIQTITVIKEVIKHETCRDVPIPNADKWLYYQTGGD